MKSPLKEIIIALVIGSLVGYFAATRSFERPAPHKRGQLVEKFSRELRLSPEQKEKVRVILESKREQFKALREEMRPRYERLQASIRGDIEKVLTPEQLPAFQKMEAEWQERREKRRGIQRP